MTLVATDGVHRRAARKVAGRVNPLAGPQEGSPNVMPETPADVGATAAAEAHLERRALVGDGERMLRAVRVARHQRDDRDDARVAMRARHLFILRTSDHRVTPIGVTRSIESVTDQKSTR